MGLGLNGVKIQVTNLGAHKGQKFGCKTLEERTIEYIFERGGLKMFIPSQREA